MLDLILKLLEQIRALTAARQETKKTIHDQFVLPIMETLNAIHEKNKELIVESHTYMGSCGPLDDATFHAFLQMIKTKYDEQESQRTSARAKIVAISSESGPPLREFIMCVAAYLAMPEFNFQYSVEDFLPDGVSIDTWQPTEANLNELNVQARTLLMKNILSAWQSHISNLHGHVIGAYEQLKRQLLIPQKL